MMSMAVKAQLITESKACITMLTFIRDGHSVGMFEVKGNLQWHAEFHIMYRLFCQQSCTVPWRMLARCLWHGKECAQEEQLPEGASCCCARLAGCYGLKLKQQKYLCSQRFPISRLHALALAAQTQSQIRRIAEVARDTLAFTERSTTLSGIAGL